MSLAGPRARLLILATIVVATTFTVMALRGGASADFGTEGYSSDDFCGKLARLDFVMTAGFEHQHDIGLPATIYTEVKCIFNQSASAEAPQALLPVKLEGNPPWVDVTGEFDFGGDYMAEGHGTVAGVQNVKVVLDAFIETDYTMAGTYTMGADGELGTEAVYAVNGEFGTATLPTPTPVGQTPKPAPTEAPGQQVTWGDNNCSGQADPVDALVTLRHDAGLSANTGDCPDLGTQIDVTTAVLRIWGDFDCSDAVDPIDALKLLRFDAGLSVGQNAGCPQPGSAVQIPLP